jgi:hypothetical protein
VASFAPTSQLAHTLDVRRAIRRQVIAVSILLAVAAGCRLSPLHEPEPLTLATIAVCGVILLVELGLAFWEQDEADRYADDLILAGFAGTTRSTPIGCAVARRLARLESSRARHRLAEDLRWRVRLANGWTRPSPGYMRASVLPPLSEAQRTVFREDSGVIAAIAARIEDEPADPRALVSLQRLITFPPGSEPVHRTSDQADELRDQLDTIRQAVTAPADSWLPLDRPV